MSFRSPLWRTRPSMLKEIAADAGGMPSVKRPDRRRMIKSLGHIPGASALLRLRLQIAAREVNSHRVAKNHRRGIFDADIDAVLMQRHHQFNFVMQFSRARRKRQLARIADHRIRRLAEKKWQILARILAHFAHVVGVVSTDAVDPVHREALFRPGDCDGGYGKLRNLEHRCALCQRRPQLVVYRLFGGLHVRSLPSNILYPIEL